MDRIEKLGCVASELQRMSGTTPRQGPLYLLTPVDGLRYVFETQIRAQRLPSFQIRIIFAVNVFEFLPHIICSLVPVLIGVRYPSLLLRESYELITN